MVNDKNQAKFHQNSPLPEASDLEWLKIQQELEAIERQTEPFLQKAKRMTLENPFVPLGLLTSLLFC